MYPSVVLRLLESLFRRPLLHLLPIVLAGAVGVFFVSQQPPVYDSGGVVLIDESTDLDILTDVRNADRSFQTPAARAESQLRALLGTSDFMSQVGAGLGVVEPEERIAPGLAIQLRGSLSVRTSGENLLVIGASREEAAEAAAVANATVEAFVAYRTDLELEQTTSAEAFLSQQAADLELELQAAESAVADYAVQNPVDLLTGERPPSVQIELDSLTSELERVQDRYGETVSQLNQTQLAAAVTRADAENRVRVIDEPVVPTEPSGSLTDDAIVVLAFLVLGGLVAAASIGLGAVLDSTVRFPGDVQRHLGLEVLSVLPEVRSSRVAWGGR